MSKTNQLHRVVAHVTVRTITEVDSPAVRACHRAARAFQDHADLRILGHGYGYGWRQSDTGTTRTIDFWYPHQDPAGVGRPLMLALSRLLGEPIVR